MSVKDELDEEAPLDPATERLRRKMVRLLAVSISIMMIGLMAVLGAIVYRISNSGEASPEAAGSGEAVSALIEGRIEINPGARIISTALDGNRVLLHIRGSDGVQTLLVYGLAEDRVIARIAIE